MKTIAYYTFITIFLLFLASCGGGEDDGEVSPGRGFGNFGGGQPVSVEAMPVQAGSISKQVLAYGTIKAQDVVVISPQVSNRVTNILVDLGDNVSRGQVMAEIYDVPFQDEFQQAQAQVRQARTTFERDSSQFLRQRQLHERDLISSSEFDDAQTTYLNSRAQYESAEAALTQSRENLENTKITSPVDGVVLSRSIAAGDIASTGQAVFEVANLVGFETRVFLPLQDWEQVQIGQYVSMSLSSRGSEIAEGVVSRKSPQLDTTTGLGEIVITLTESGGSVYQGALVQSRINLETRENTIVIPRSAMVETVDTYIEPETGTIELDRTYSVFVVQGDTSAVRKSLTLGIEQGDRIEVLDGLSAGESLIITGQNNLENESPVRVAGSESVVPAVNPQRSVNQDRREQRNVNQDQREQRRGDARGRARGDTTSQNSSEKGELSGSDNQESE